MSDPQTAPLDEAELIALTIVEQELTGIDIAPTVVDYLVSLGGNPRALADAYIGFAGAMAGLLQNLDDDHRQCFLEVINDARGVTA